MPEPEQILPLFPLNVVLFPRAPLPLHIFEERYKQMVAAALEGEGLFGGICTDGGGAARTGCCAKIVKVVKRYDDGRMDILTVGVRRFRIARLLRKKSLSAGAGALLRRRRAATFPNSSAVVCGCFTTSTTPRRAISPTTSWSAPPRPWFPSTSPTSATLA